MKLSQIATTPVATIRAEDEIDTAMRLMWILRLRHLPVVREDGVCIGMLSDRDVLDAVDWLPREQRRAARPGTATAAAGPTRVKQIMSVPSIGLSPESPLEHAIELMLEKRINAVPLVLEQRVIGIVTSTDILRRFLDDRDDPRGSWRFERIAARMSRQVERLHPGDPLEAARTLMRQRRIRHIPVVENAALVGIVSDRDVRCALGHGAAERAAETVESLRISDIMTREVARADARDTLADAAERMLARRIGCLPVVGDEHLIGILTPSDLMRALDEACLAPRQAIGRYDTTHAATVDP